MERLFEIANKVIHYTKKFFWILFAIAGAIFATKALRKKEDGQKQSESIQKVTEAEGKIAEDKEKIKDLEKKEEEARMESATISDKYKEKLKESEAKKEDEKPGSAGKSSDDLTNTW